MTMNPRTASGMAALGLAALLTAPLVRAQTAETADPWSRLPGILAGIKAPVFPNRDFPITSFGAKPDGATDATEAFRKAIAECVRAGGGRVVVPAGEFLTGPIHLKSGVNLHVQKGATVRFSTDPNRYLPVVKTRFEGVEVMNYSPLIYALGQENIAVTGEGTLDGQASDENWWKWKGRSTPAPGTQRADRDKLFQQAEDGVPVEQRIYGAGHFLRPSFIEPYESRNILIEGVTIRNAPFWIIHPTLSSNVTIRGVTVISHGPNNDGADPESSTDVLIENAVFDTGDDCIAIKSGRNADGRRVNKPSERIVIRNSTMRAGHGGVTVGSEVSGSVRDVFAEKLIMSSPDLERGIRLKTNAVRGGVIENVFARDIEIGEVGSAIDIDLLYEEGARGAFLPTVRNVRVERMTVKKAAYA
ncbi:MAG TPA: glycoside hydrolase family 28 protein, partial [Vicinamibacteria bacterium]|nr:glycoside hydrolase family 28 protein [Vicinamibacteria bacterium]